MAGASSNGPIAAQGTPKSTTNGSSRKSPSQGQSNSTPTTRMKAGGGGMATTMIPPSQGVPLSTRRAAGLDMSSVEHRQIPSTKEQPKKNRPHGITEAPTYRPTEEEFKDPFKYIQSIAEEGRKYGIVKIIPPDTWNPPFCIDTERFHFKTRRQELNSVEGGTRANLNYLDQLNKFHSQHGMTLNRYPSVDKRPLDLYRLKKAVDIRGGFDKVCKGKKWAEIGRDLGYSGKIMSSLSTSLKNSYQKYLHPYEEYVKTAKPGVQQQLEAEYGGPLTPSPAGSPAGKMAKNLMKSPGGIQESPLARTAFALNSSGMREKPVDSDNDSPMPDAGPVDASETSTPGPAGGFTPVNMGGFTAVNGNAFTAVNSIKKENEPTPAPNETPRPSSRGSKRHHSENSDSPSKDPGADAEKESGERRSKRLKKAPTVAGSNMIFHRPATPRPDRPNKTKPGEKCEKCGRGDDATSLLLCDGCDHGYHTYCLDPPVKTIPERDWYCNRCLVGTGEFGFEDGPVYSLKQFQEKANNFKENYFGSKMTYDPVLNTKRQVTEDDVEQEFWRLVESLHETVEVEYGADIHSTTHGSGFPVIEKDPLNKYSHDPWNLNILPLHNESLFRHIKSDVSGMTVPWLYVGMCFSTFCWHNEDHYTYSANYQHFGATKTWYGIPCSDALKFENAMRDAVPELFEQQPDLLFQLVTLLTPTALTKAGVKVYAIDQRAGQFVITFPQAYHAGFNHGFNFNEAVNFAPPDWEPYGRAGVERYHEFRKQPVFSHEELLLTAAARDTSIKTALWLAPALEKIRDAELESRSTLRELVPGITEQLVEGDLAEEQYQCIVCKSYCYLSQVICDCTTNVGCIEHHQDICDCSSDKHILRLKHNDEALKELVDKVRDKANMPKAWTAKLQKFMLESPRPALKTLRSLLAEGEKIPATIPELPALKSFVERANEWVEEATNYISRKQQNRRKNEKVWRKGNAKAAELEERDKELRKVDNIVRLLQEADQLSFEAPEIEQLRERAEAISDFQAKARYALADAQPNSGMTVEQYEELAEAGRSFNVDLVETEQLDKLIQQCRWIKEIRDMKYTGKVVTLKECQTLIDQGYELGMKNGDGELLGWLEAERNAGQLWSSKARDVMSQEPIHYAQLDSLSRMAQLHPYEQEILDQVDQILNKQREAQRQVQNLVEKAKSVRFHQRPHYKDARDVMDSLTAGQVKPAGTIDLEKELKRHEDWMRRGKKLFGKANAPLHILLSHMMYVEGRNNACFALEDRPRTPVEPSSREQSPDPNSTAPSFGVESSKAGRLREIFCICRQPEAGMMIECEICHEWYHGKCLKIARGKVKEEDKYTCPICDHRVKIPRDAARPKLEDLQVWESEIMELPFQPEEQACLSRIISVSQKFRDHLHPFCQNAFGLTSAEVPTMRFYLRKIEGAEVLLAQEHNFLRAELHRWMPIAPDPPPILSASLSTRKPRPTKQQKLMMSLGIENPEELPVQLRTKAHQFKKAKDITQKTPTNIKPAPRLGSPGSSTSPSTIHHPQFDYGSSGYDMEQESPPFRPGLHDGMEPSIRGRGLDTLLFNSPPPPVSFIPGRLQDVEHIPSTANQIQEMSTMFEFDAASANQEPSDVLMKDISGAMAQSNEAERVALAQQAANEALTLQQFSTLHDDDRDNEPGSGPAPSSVAGEAKQ
ncbi:hypothetical protein TWF718_008795 [Orbilia javanica]|uniref:[histone H3]-trimethyl-L-lysine(4) demethylase n=1 Tax=Orbilia javanica TaxID=47235 RepID=A0AAN8MNL2_9PEZI